MAETRLMVAELDRIGRDLDNLVMPDFETVRRLVAEIRRLGGEAYRLSAALAEVGSVIDRTTRETL